MSHVLPETRGTESGQSVGVCRPWKGARRDSLAFCLHETSPRPHVCLKYLHLPLCSPCWQKINAFSHDINSLIEGEESVGENDSRLFTKIRNEFHKWNTVIEKAFQKGESGVPPVTWRAGWSGRGDRRRAGGAVGMDAGDGGAGAQGVETTRDPAHPPELGPAGVSCGFQTTPAEDTP